jgi:hypothetical protein
MYEFVWKVLTWPVAALASAIVITEATSWIGDDGLTDRIMGAIVCGFLAGAVWLMLSSTLRYLAEK